MKAIQVIKHGAPEDLVISDIHTPEIQDHQVLIEAHYAGVNFPDTLIIQGKYQFQPELPFTPGGECAGFIKKVGSKVKGLEVGDRVISGSSWGSYAQEVVSFGNNTFKIPESISLKTGACFLQTYMTGYHALVDRGQAKSNETILILGAAGGTGIAAIQIAKMLNLKVIAAASTEEKRNSCLQEGADYAISNDTEEFRFKINELTDGKGLDLVYDPVGGSLAELAFRSLNFGGRHLVIGFASGQIPNLRWNLPLLKCASIVGVFWGRLLRDHPEQNRKNAETLIKWLDEGKLHPQVSAEYELENAYQALNSIAQKTAVGKLAIKLR